MSFNGSHTWVIYGLRLVDDFEYRYIGLTTRGIKARLKGHKDSLSYGTKSRVYSWIKSIGFENIEYDILEECPIGNIDYLNEAEMFWISQIRSFGHRLKNHTDGGGGMTGHTWTLSLETRIRQSISKTGSLNPNYGAKHQWNLGKKMSDQFVQKRSESQAILWESEEYRKMMSESHRGKVNSGQTERSLAVCHKRWHLDRGLVVSSCSLCVDSGLPFSSQDEVNLAKKKFPKTLTKTQSENQSQVAKRVSHERWHLKRSIVNPTCLFCKETNVD